MIATVPAVAQQGIILSHNLPSDTLSCSDELVVTATAVGSSPDWHCDWDKSILELFQVADTDKPKIVYYKFRPLVADTFAAIVVYDHKNPDVYDVLHLEIRPVVVTRIYLTDGKKRESTTISKNESALSLTVDSVETFCSGVKFIGRMKIDQWIIEPKDWNKGAGIEFVDNNVNAPQRSIRATTDNVIDSTKVIVVYRQSPTPVHPVTVFLRDTFYVSVLPNYVSKVTLKDGDGNVEGHVQYDESVTLQATIAPFDATDKSIEWKYDEELLDYKAVVGADNHERIFSPKEGGRLGVTTTITAKAKLTPSTTVIQAVYTLHIRPARVTIIDKNGKTDTTVHRYSTVTLTAKVTPDNAPNNPTLHWEIPLGLDVISPVQEGKYIIQPTKADTTFKVKVKAVGESGIEEAVYTIKVLPVHASTIEIVDADGGTNTTARKGDTVALTAMVYPMDAVNKNAVKWSIVPDTGIVKFVSIKGKNTDDFSRRVVLQKGDASVAVKVTVSDTIEDTYHISALPTALKSLSLSRWGGDTIQRGERLTLYASLIPTDAVNSRVEWSYSPSDAVKFVDVKEEAPYERTIEALRPNTNVKITVKTPDGIFMDHRSIYIERNYLNSLFLQRTDKEVFLIRSVLRSTDDCTLKVNIDPEDISNFEISWKAEGDLLITPSKSDPLLCLVKPKYANAEGSVTVTVETEAGELKQATHTFIIPLDGISLTDASEKTDSIVDLGKMPLPKEVKLVPHLFKAPTAPVSIKEDYSKINWDILTPQYAYFDESVDAELFPCRRLCIFEEVTGGDIRVRLSAIDGSGLQAIYTLTIKPVGVQSLTVKDKKGLSSVSNVEKGDTVELIASYTPTSIINPKLEWTISPVGAAEFVEKNPAYKDWECAVRILQSDTEMTVTVQSLDGNEAKASYIINLNTPPLGIDLPSETEPFALYRQGILHLHHAEGFLCYITTLTGRVVTVFHETASTSIRPLQLPSGVYVFTMIEGSRKFVFKFIAD
jgi:uncharacterized protein YjdB